MKYFPVTIVDNFYENPNFVRDYALSLEYFPSENGEWPGSRTELLSVLNPSLFKIFCNKLFGLFFDFNTSKLNWRVETNFQKINSFSSDINDVKNSGWIHADADCIFAGVIYLNQNPTSNWGTSIYNLKDGEVMDYLNDGEVMNCYQKTKLLHLSNSKDFNEEEYKVEKHFNNSKFSETVKVENVYNRLIAYEGEVFHGVPNYYSKNNEPRLTQVFFVKELSGNSLYPLVRSRIPNFL